MAACISNPCRGAIDPDVIEGKKMIGKMIEGLAEEDKFDLKNEKIVEFKDNLEEAVNAFFCRSVVRAIPLVHDENGNFAHAANLLTRQGDGFCATNLGQ